MELCVVQPPKLLLAELAPVRFQVGVSGQVSTKGGLDDTFAAHRTLAGTCADPE